MLIKRLAEYVMRGRKEAAIAAFLATLVPFMGWIGVAIVALVTLRKGALEGFVVLLWTIIPSLAFAVGGQYLPLIFGVFAGSVVTWILAVVLRETGSWSQVLQCGGLIAIIGIIAMHCIVPDITTYWFNIISAYYSKAEKDLALPLTATDVKSLTWLLAKLATGIQAFFLLLVNLFNLVAGRFAQALLYNPEGLQELREIRLGLAANCLLLVTIAGSALSYAWALDSLPVVLGIFFIAGLSLIHALIAHTRSKFVWTLGFYGVLIYFFRYSVPIVVVFAIADTGVNFRKHLGFNL